jgi:rod shape-determining protein MreC
MLHKQLERYVQLDSEWMKEKEENARLREILGFEKPQKNKTIVARIVSREPGSWFQWVIIDKGASEGLSVDVPILMIKDGMMCVVGRVGETFDHSSKVILLTNALFAIPGMLSSTKGDGLVEGQNNPYLKMNYLLSREKLERGEIVVTSPLSSVVPEDIAIGRIKSVEPQTDETFSSAIVEPLIDLGSLREVIALLPENDNPGKRALQRSRNEPNIFQKNKKKSDLK